MFISGLNDSKQLSAAKRDMLYNEVMAKALDIEVNIVSVSNIDELNIYAATQQGMAQVLENLHCKPQAALIDAMPVKVPDMKIESVVHGDALSASIAAASIIARLPVTASWSALILFILPTALRITRAMAAAHICRL